MYAMRTKTRAAAERSNARKQREDEAPRLRDSVSAILSLEIELVEDAGTSSTKHRKHVVIASAPALFLIPCGDKECRDGGHDITLEVMRSLQQGSGQVTGEHFCQGQVGTLPCSRKLQYQTFAVFRCPEEV